jgi:hypothetical protein
VTCCFTAQEQVVQLFVNEIEITSLLTPQNGLADAAVAKTVTFTEPSGPAMFAVKGYENNEIKIASLFLICKSTRNNSSWNFVSSMAHPWKTVLSSSVQNDVFPANWYSNYNYSGLTQSPAQVSTESITLNTSLCGTPNNANKLRPNQGVPARKYWTLKLFVNQTVQCGTNSPTGTRTDLPTSLPTTGTPSVTPTKLPTSQAPTKSPSMLPTISPTVSLPTRSPSLSAPTSSPTKSAPTTSPSVAPATRSPTSSPTPCVPGVVSCCLTGRQYLVQMFVNEVDVTGSLSPQNSMNDTAVTKTISFTEPSNIAVIGIKGFENNELYLASLMIRCECTRPNSPWNFASTPAYKWRSVLSSTTRDDSFPSDWYKLSSTGSLSAVVPITDSYTMTSNGACGVVNQTEKLRVPQGTPARFYWTMRLVVNQTVPCGTNSPTLTGPLNVVGSNEDAAPAPADTAAPTTDVGMIAGIVAGVVALALLVGGLLVARRRRQSQTGAPPPNEWEEQFDEDSGSKFWINRKTGEFSWTSPNEIPGAAAAQQTTLASAPIGDDAAAQFWMNKKTGEFGYSTAPEDAVESSVVPRSAVPPTTTAQDAQVATLSQNSKTGEFSYESTATAAASAASAPTSSSKTWTEMYDASKNSVYWVNSKTGEFSQTNPYVNETL